MLYPLSYGGEFHAIELENTLGQYGHISFRRFRHLRRRRRVRRGCGGPVSVRSGDCAHRCPQALFFALGTRPPTEVGARALRFRRPARCDVARLRTLIRPKGAQQ